MEKELNVVEKGLSFFRKNSMVIILVAIMFVFQILTNGLLMKPLNITNLFLQNSYIDKSDAPQVISLKVKRTIKRFFDTPCDIRLLKYLTAGSC